jgi:hypothetical protein
MAAEDSANDKEVRLPLTPAQVEYVVRAVNEEGAAGAGLRGVLSRLGGGGKDVALANLTSDPAYADKKISQSLVLGMLIFCQFSADGAELGVRDVAERTGVPHSTTHRYLRTLKAIGLLEQNADTRKYRLPAGTG